MRGGRRQTPRSVRKQSRSDSRAVARLRSPRGGEPQLEGTVGVFEGIQHELDAEILPKPQALHDRGGEESLPLGARQRVRSEK